MSNDPKQPFDAPPGGTPSILQQEMDLDRRSRNVPGFDQLRVRPTAPMAAPPTKLPPPSPTEWANRNAPVATVLPRMPVVSSPQPEALGLGENEPTRIAPYNLPGATVPPKAKSSGTPWKMRDPSAPMPTPTPSAPPMAPIDDPPVRSSAKHAALGEKVAARATGQSLDPLQARPRAPAPAPAPAPARPRPPAHHPTLEPAAPLSLLAAIEEETADAAPPEEAPVAKPARATKPASRPAAKVTVVGQVHASPAGLFRRTISWVIDLGVIAAVVTGLLFIAMTVIFPSGAGSAHMLALLEKVALPAAALGALIAFVYSALFAFLWQGRTFGRRFVGIHLVDTTGSAPGPVRAVFRAMLSVVSFAFFLAGFWLALFDRRGQTLHDKLSRTFVVRLGADAS